MAVETVVFMLLRVVGGSAVAVSRGGKMIAQKRLDGLLAPVHASEAWRDRHWRDASHHKTG